MRLLAMMSLLVAFASCTPKEPVEIGASCSATEKIEACAVGQSAACIGGKWEATLICPDGCVRKMIGHGNSAPVCDNAVATTGMVCTTPNSRICSADGHAQLVCEGARWKLEKACPASCTFPKTGIACL